MLSQPFTFVLPAELSAKEPPERRRSTRDRVRLITINRNGDQVEHTCFDGIGKFLRPGDLLVLSLKRWSPRHRPLSS